MTRPLAAQIESIYYRYDSSLPYVLESLTFSIRFGAVTAILGPNGCGKTTLLRLMLGILSPTAGQILLDGRSQSTYSRRALSRLVGLVPQNEHVPFDFAVLDYVSLGRAPYLSLLEAPGEEDTEIARRALDAVGQLGLAQRLVPTLSGGEKQLVTVARALAQSPRLILLDEPISHLDYANRRRILELMRTMADAGAAVVFTTHDPNAAATRADDAVLLRDGVCQASGPSLKVLTAENLAAIYKVPVKLHYIDGFPVIID